MTKILFINGNAFLAWFLWLLVRIIKQQGRGGAAQTNILWTNVCHVQGRIQEFQNGGWGWGRGPGAAGFSVWRLFWCPFTYISYLSIVRVDNKIHIVNIESWLQLNYCVLCSQYLQKQPQYFVQIGAPVLEPPLMSTYKWYTRTYKRIGFQHEDDFVHLNMLLK